MSTSQPSLKQSAVNLSETKQYRLSELIQKEPKPHPLAEKFGDPPNLAIIRQDIISAGIRDAITSYCDGDGYVILDGVVRLFRIAIPHHAENPPWDPIVNVDEWTPARLKKEQKTVAALILGPSGRNFLRRAGTKGQRATTAAHIYVELVENGQDDALLSELIKISSHPSDLATTNTDKQLSEARRDRIASFFELSGIGIQPVITAEKRARKAKTADSVWRLLLDALYLDLYPPSKLLDYVKLNSRDRGPVKKALEAAKKKPADVASREFRKDLDALVRNSNSPSSKSSSFELTNIPLAVGSVPKDLLPVWHTRNRVCKSLEKFTESFRDTLAGYFVNSDDSLCEELCDIVNDFEDAVLARFPSHICPKCRRKDADTGEWVPKRKTDCPHCRKRGFVALRPDRKDSAHTDVCIPQSAMPNNTGAETAEKRKAG